MSPRSALASCLALAALVAGAAAARAFDPPGAPPRPRGTVTGTVRIPGAAPPPGVLRVHKERAFCGPLVPDQRLIVAADRGLKNAVVTLHGPGLDRRPARPRAIRLDNIGCRFAPHVQAAAVGSALLLLNSDPILHDAHGRIGVRTLFNDGLPWWRRVNRTLREPGVIRIICELHHAWMSAYIVVAPNPFFAVTDHRGRYAIEGVPPGSYEARFWHEKLGESSRQVAVGRAGARLDVTLRGR